MPIAMLKKQTFMHMHIWDFDKTKCISFLIKDEELLQKYNEIWKKASIIIKKEFDSNPVYNEKYIKTKIKSSGKKKKIK